MHSNIHKYEQVVSSHCTLLIYSIEFTLQKGLVKLGSFTIKSMQFHGSVHLYTHSKDLNENTSKSWRSLGTQKALEGHQRAPKDTWTFPHSCHLPLGQRPINYSKEGNKNTGNSWSLYFGVKANEKAKIFIHFFVMLSDIINAYRNIFKISKHTCMHLGPFFCSLHTHFYWKRYHHLTPCTEHEW